MSVNILTQEDLQTFKSEFLEELKIVLNAIPKTPQKQWLKSPEVRKMIGISKGTLQTLRNKKAISYTRVGGLTFYSYQDIVKMMEDNKRGGQR
jgi:hypothetical protein